MPRLPIGPLRAIRTTNPWLRAYTVGQFLYKQGRKRLEENLNANERRELGSLMGKSKGRRSNLTPKEQQRLMALVRKAARGK